MDSHAGSCVFTHVKEKLALSIKHRCCFGILLLGLIVPIVTGCILKPETLRDALYQRTGEEGVGSQARALLQWSVRWTRALPQTAADTLVAYSDLPPYGVNTFLEQEVEPQKRERSLQLIADAGFQWIRQEFAWEDIEIHGKGNFEDRRHEPYRSAWKKYDHIVTAAEAHDLRIIARLSNPPTWSRADGDARGEFAPPDDFGDYVDFVEAVVSRYRGRIRFYQIWNEPNIYPEWGKQPADPEGYTRLLCLAYNRIKAVDPEAVVVSAALAPTEALGTLRADGGNDLMDVIFLQRMYDAGAGDCFDVLAVNDYMLWSGPTDRRMTPYLINFSRPQWVRDVMVANGDADKAIWITEMNSNTVPEGMPAPYGRVSQTQQARYAVEALERIRREWPWVGVTTVWFFKRASDAEADQPMYYFRLMEPDFTPLPVYAALREHLTNKTPTLYPGRHVADAWPVSHADWETSGTTLHGDAGERLSVTWEGKRLQLFPGKTEGTIEVQTNDAPGQLLSIEGAPVTLHTAQRTLTHTTTITVVEGPITLHSWTVE